MEEVKKDEEDQTLGIDEDDIRGDEGLTIACWPREEENKEENVP